MRILSINAGLLASTVTPGNTPPEGSRTTPANVVWAWAKVGRRRNPRRSNERDTDLIEIPLLPHESADISDVAAQARRHPTPGSSALEFFPIEYLYRRADIQDASARIFSLWSECAIGFGRYIAIGTYTLIRNHKLTAEPAEHAENS
jgi:hypothetical protein